MSNFSVAQTAERLNVKPDTIYAVRRLTGAGQKFGAAARGPSADLGFDADVIEAVEVLMSYDVPISIAFRLATAGTWDGRSLTIRAKDAHA